MVEKIEGPWEALLFFVIGAIIGVGKLLSSKEADSVRLIIGRAISTGAVAVAAGAILIWVPNLPQLGRIGVAAGLAVLGTAGLERILMRIIGQAKSTVEGQPNE